MQEDSPPDTLSPPQTLVVLSTMCPRILEDRLVRLSAADGILRDLFAKVSKSTTRIKRSDLGVMQCLKPMYLQQMPGSIQLASDALDCRVTGPLQQNHQCRSSPIRDSSLDA